MVIFGSKFEVLVEAIIMILMTKIIQARKSRNTLNRRILCMCLKVRHRAAEDRQGIRARLGGR